MFNSGGSSQTFGFWQQLFFTVWNCFLGYRLGYRFIEFDVEEGEHTAYIRQFIYKEYIPIDTRKMIAKAVTWKFWEVSHFIFFCLILSWTGFKIQNCEKLSLVSEIAADLNFVRIIDKDIVFIIFVFLLLSMLNGISSYFKFNNFQPQSRVDTAVIWIFIISTSYDTHYCHWDVVYIIIIQEERGVELPILWTMLIVINEMKCGCCLHYACGFDLLGKTLVCNEFQVYCGIQWEFFSYPQDLGQQ